MYCCTKICDTIKNYIHHGKNQPRQEVEENSIFVKKKYDSYTNNFYGAVLIRNTVRIGPNTKQIILWYEEEVDTDSCTQSSRKAVYIIPIVFLAILVVYFSQVYRDLLRLYMLVKSVRQTHFGRVFQSCLLDRLYYNR